MNIGIKVIEFRTTDWSMITFYWTMIVDWASKKASVEFLMSKTKFSSADFISSREVPRGSSSGLVDSLDESLNPF